MNILIFVVAMLMMLTVMTYAKVQTFTSHLRVHRESVVQLREQEQLQIALRECALYNESKGVKSDVLAFGDGEEEEETDASCPKQLEDQDSKRLVRKLDIGILFSEEDQGSEVFLLTRQWLEDSVTYAYGGAPFFRQMLDADPTLVQRWVDALLERGRYAENQRHITSMEKMARVDLDDPQLQLFFYHLMKGRPGKQGYPELKDFVRVTKGAKVSLYLASEPLLRAILRDEILVQRAMELRMQLYREVNADRLSKEDATKQLREAFARPEWEQLVEYKVTKTHP